MSNFTLEDIKQVIEDNKEVEEGIKKSLHLIKTNIENVTLAFQRGKQNHIKEAIYQLHDYIRLSKEIDEIRSEINTSLVNIIQSHIIDK